jgi:hypothetical protein
MAPKTTIPWRTLAAYPGALGPDVGALLDQVEELLPVSRLGDRKTSALAWLGQALGSGILTPAEAARAQDELRPTLHAKPDRYFLHLFLDGEDEILYEDGESERLRESAAHRSRETLIRLVGGRSTATILPLTRQKGIVRGSNCLPPGAVIFSRVPWNRAAHLRGTWTEDTLVHPKSLEILEPSRRQVA